LPLTVVMKRSVAQDGRLVGPPLENQNEDDALVLSGPSPSGRYYFAFLCDTLACGVRKLIDLDSRSVFQINTERFVRSDWISWSPLERYAVMAVENAGDRRLCAVDLVNHQQYDLGQATPIKGATVHTDLESAHWTSADEFAVRITTEGDTKSSFIQEVNFARNRVDFRRLDSE
jgi:hypothetical protein